MSYNRNRYSKVQQTYFFRNKSSHFGGNRKDPLNLNELIQKKQQSSSSPSQPTKDYSVEILLQPNIFDPLCLDISSYSDQTNLQQVLE